MWTWDVVRKYMYDLGVPDGLGAMGYTNADVEQLVKGDLETLFVTISEIFPRKINRESLHTT